MMLSRERVLSLSADELRVAIAQELGWKWIHMHSVPETNPPYREFVSLYSPIEWEQEKDNPFWVMKELPWKPWPQPGYNASFPDWPHDLTAMYALEGELTDKQRRDYERELTRIINDLNDFDSSQRWQLIHATAEQRARAWYLVRAEGG